MSYCEIHGRYLADTIGDCPQCRVVDAQKRMNVHGTVSFTRGEAEPQPSAFAGEQRLDNQEGSMRTENKDSIFAGIADDVIRESPRVQAIIEQEVSVKLAMNRFNEARAAGEPAQPETPAAVRELPEKWEKAADFMQHQDAIIVKELAHELRAALSREEKS